MFVTIFAQEFEWCIGWQNSGAQTKDGKDLTLLGGMNLKIAC